ncbi:MAG: RNA methyltransferase [Nitrospirae bacterium]|nr:RNA methyltransferase [Nitrospirota bacterium]
MRLWKDNIFFILVEPREPGNIGACARAIKNMGFKNLELINPAPFLTPEAKRMACNASDLLEKATVWTQLNNALKDKNLVIGTTRRVGKRRGLILPLKESVEKIVAASQKNKVAILFGREDKGLNNKEVEECGLLIIIPSDPLLPSLNLAQSVLLVAYELGVKTYNLPYPSLVKHEELENLYSHINSVLKLLEYIPKGNRDIEKRIMRNLKHLIGRGGLTEWEMRMIHGICSQIEKRLRISNIE